MYTTTMNPWQSSAYMPQQNFASQSFLPFQISPQIQGYSIPLQTGASNISPWAYQFPYANAMISSAGNMQTGISPQGAVAFGYSSNPAWQSAYPVMSGQFSPLTFPMRQQQLAYNPMGMTTGINAPAGLAQPRVELAETNNDVIVTADLPNVDPNNIYITVTDDSLSISALSMMGGNYSSLHRTVALPTSIRAEHLDVSYTNGTLECRLPKSDLVARRRVKV